MNLSPIGTKVILAYDSDSRFENGIWLPGNGRRMDAKVVAVGNRVTKVHVGDTVIADRRGMLEIRDEGVSYRLGKEEDIEAVVG